MPTNMSYCIIDVLVLDFWVFPLPAITYAQVCFKFKITSLIVILVGGQSQFCCALKLLLVAKVYV